MKKLVGATVLLVLSGCSARPSSSAMEDAYLKYLQENDSSITIEQFKHGDCAKAGNQPGYACSVQADITYMRGANHTTMEGTFVFDKIGGDWKVVSQTN